jgi:aminodeoxyfutalosine synthase
MRSLAPIELLLNDPGLSADHQHIAQKILDNQRLTFDEGLFLFEQGSLSFVGTLANAVREQKNGDNTYFNRNFHIEPTNLCVYDCKFCSYSRLIKQRSDADSWAFTMEEMMDIVRKYDGQPVTEVHIVGGVLPQYDLAFYLDFFKKIKEHRPELHVKALDASGSTITFLKKQKSVTRKA